MIREGAGIIQRAKTYNGIVKGNYHWYRGGGDVNIGDLKRENDVNTEHNEEIE